MAYHPIYVPQVVLLVMEESARQELLMETYSVDDPALLLAQGFSVLEADLLTEIMKWGILSAYGPDVNIRVVNSTEELSGKYSTLTLKIGEPPERAFGRADQVDFGNITIDDNARIFIKPLRTSFQYAHQEWVLGIRQPLIEPVPPMTVYEQEFSFSRTATHEQGHLLGLVKDNLVLNGYLIHNRHEDTIPISYPPRHMNYGRYSLSNNGVVYFSYKATIEERIGREGDFVWRSINKAYLRFVLPKP